MAYLGLGLRRALLGDGQRRGALTKAGNTQARRVLVEAAWHYRHRPVLGRALIRGRHRQPAACLGHAWRAQQRWYRRYRHLVGYRKRPPIAVAAVARNWSARSRMSCPSVPMIVRTTLQDCLS